MSSPNDGFDFDSDLFEMRLPFSLQIPRNCGRVIIFISKIDTKIKKESIAEKKRWIMESTEWNTAFENALQTLQQNVSSEIDLNSFTFEENQNRFTVKGSSLPKFKIFPWFHGSAKSRFRQTLKKDSSLGPTIKDVIEATNYFLRKNGCDYSEVEIQFLRTHFESMEIPSHSDCLTSIVFVYHEFRRFQGAVSGNFLGHVTPEFEQIGDDSSFIISSEPENTSLHPHDSGIDPDLGNLLLEHEHQLGSLRNRVGKLEVAKANQVPAPGSKRPRGGGDRACWFKIRDADYPSRDEWCTPGSVFGLYADGVGPLLPNHICPRRSVVVYSTDPDIVEPHPNPLHQDRYARVVMVRSLFFTIPPPTPSPPFSSLSDQVGEAPVRLRPDQYEKLMRWKCLCDVYVNSLGDICIRQFGRAPLPPGETVFGTTDCWIPTIETGTGIQCSKAFVVLV